MREDVVVDGGSAENAVEQIPRTKTLTVRSLETLIRTLWSARDNRIRGQQES